MKKVDNKTENKKNIKIAMLSFADIDNYGDVFFPYIFKGEIIKRIPNAQLYFFTPSGKNFNDIKFQPYHKSTLSENNFTAIILAGGEIIHNYDEKTWLPLYKKMGLKIKSNLPSDIVWDWIDIDGPFKAWFSVGVRPFNEIEEKIQHVIDTINHISVRGILSKKIIEKEWQKNETKINIIPDMGWLFPEYIRKVDNKKIRQLEELNCNYCLFQTNSISEQDARIIAHTLKKFENKTSLKVVLIPVIRPWEDEKYLKMINDVCDEKDKFILLPNDLNIWEIGRITLSSKFVISSSLHLAITALADGIPAGIINKWQGTKLQDLFGLQFRTKYLRHHFNLLDEMLNNLYRMSSKEKNLLSIYKLFAIERLSLAFDELCSEILKSKEQQ